MLPLFAPEGSLVPRSVDGAVLHDPAGVADRVLRMVTEGRLTAIDGTEIAVEAESVCLHGDSPGAVAMAEAVRTARDDLAKGRVPWISFTFPYSWSDMAAGRGDAWARNLAAQFAQLDGPVWLAFHHEPENDSGDVLQWRRAQERLAPIVRSTAPNVAYTVILMGYHQLYGRTDVYGLDRIWPRTTIDVLGIDPYNFYGAPNKTRDSSANLVKEYFEPIGSWARANSVEWGVAETGYTDRAFAEDPYWLQNTFKGLRANGGVAMSYFNAAPSSVSGDWLLDTSARLSAFASTLQMTTRYRG